MNDLISAILALVYGQATICAIFLALLYLVLSLTALYGMRAQRNMAMPWERRALIVAGALHTLLLASTVWMPHPSGAALLALGFAQALSLSACIGVWLFYLEERWVAIYSLRPLALLLPAVAVLVAAFNHSVPTLLSAPSALHVLFALAAHGLALLASGHALLLWSLSRVLKSATQPPNAWFARLVRHSPPLVVLEHLLIRLTLWVTSLLIATVGLGAWSGVLRLDHKTVLTLLSLAAWLAVIWGYERRAWRGQRVCVAVWLATGLLLLAYIGSQFVLQAVLQRV